MPDPDKPSRSRSTLRFDEAQEGSLLKYVGWGLVGCLSVGVLYGAYHLGHVRGQESGYASGYGDALISGKVEAELNRLAVANLLAVLKLEHASDAQLLEQAQQMEYSFGWIQEPSVRQEAQWMLAWALLQRGHREVALPIMHELLQSAAPDPLWPRRAVTVADQLQQDGRLAEALSFYNLAASRFRSLGMQRDLLVCCYSRLALLTSQECEASACRAGLLELQQEAESLGDKGAALRADILVCLGTHYLQYGEHEAAKKLFEESLAGQNLNADTLHPQAAACYGQALMALGRAQEAQPLLESSLAAMGADPADLQYRLMALRSLARIAVERGDFHRAAALLNQAQGAAAGRLPDNDSFWTALYDQRGWALFLAEQYEAAHADFTACLRYATKGVESLQPMEGAARCLLALNRQAEAAELLSRLCALKKLHTPDAVAELADLYRTLAVTEDALGHTEKAIAAYNEAIHYFRALNAEDSTQLRETLRCLGYAEAQLKHWQEASRVWAEVSSLCGDDKDAKEEADREHDRCFRNISS